MTGRYRMRWYVPGVTQRRWAAGRTEQLGFIAGTRRDYVSPVPVRMRGCLHRLGRITPEVRVCRADATTAGAGQVLLARLRGPSPFLPTSIESGRSVAFSDRQTPASVAGVPVAVKSLNSRY